MTQESELAELVKKAKDSGSRTDLDNYLKARRKFKCPECGWFNGLHTVSCKKDLREQVEQLRAENKDLKQDLLEFGRHSKGCNYPYGEAYGCKCGWLEVAKRLA